MTRELHRLLSWKLKHLLEFLANIHEDILALLRGSTLATSDIFITTSWDTLSNGSGPDTDTVEALSNVDDYTHQFSILLFLEGFSDRCEHDVKPELIDCNGIFVFELVGPFSSVFVLNILPFGADAFLEEVVI
jgi:hypothetical protein